MFWELEMTFDQEVARFLITYAAIVFTGGLAAGAAIWMVFQPVRRVVHLPESCIIKRGRDE